MENDINKILEDEKNKILESMELSNREYVVLVKIYNNLIQKYKENKNDEHLLKNINTLQNYIFK
jgi:hypothetical protein